MDFTYFDVFGLKNTIKVPKESLAFTYCQVPFIFTIRNSNKLVITKSNKQKLTFNELLIDRRFE